MAWNASQAIDLYGGGKRDRTADLLHAMQALSQLSYTPERLRIIATLYWRVKRFVRTIRQPIAPPKKFNLLQFVTIHYNSLQSNKKMVKKAIS